MAHSMIDTAAPLDRALGKIAALRAEMDQAESVPAMRTAFSRFMRSEPVPAGISVASASFAGVPGETVRPDGRAPTISVLLVHGGGFVMGGPSDYRAFAGALALELEAAVHLPDYRLAPEAPAPAQLDDLEKAWSGLVKDGTDPAGTLFIGDSAGAALAMSLLVRLRDEGAPLPAAAVTVSGFFDLTRSSPSFGQVEDDPLLTAEALAGMVGAYAQGRDPADPALSPLFAPLGGLPPLLLLSGGRELIRDDSRRLADAVHAEGGVAALKEYPNMFHIWPVFRSFLPEAQAALADIARFARAQTGAVTR